MQEEKTIQTAALEYKHRVVLLVLMLGYLKSGCRIQARRIDMSLRILSCVGVLVIALPIATPLATAQEIPYQKNLSLQVGESAIIYGVRGWKCGQSAPSWEEIAKQLPTISTGKFSDGGLGTRWSRGCGGPTPARAIQYTATATGNEQLILFTDPVNIEVK